MELDFFFFVIIIVYHFVFFMSTCYRFLFIVIVRITEGFFFLCNIIALVITSEGLFIWSSGPYLNTDPVRSLLRAGRTFGGSGFKYYILWFIFYNKDKLSFENIDIQGKNETYKRKNWQTDQK